MTVGFNDSLRIARYKGRMWTPDEIVLELARLERQVFARVHERNAKQQLGLLFVDLPDVTTQPSDGVNQNGESES